MCSDPCNDVIYNTAVSVFSIPVHSASSTNRDGEGGLPCILFSLHGTVASIVPGEPGELGLLMKSRRGVWIRIVSQTTDSKATIYCM